MNKKDKFFTRKKIKEFLYINIGVFLMAFAYTIFIDQNQLIIGGVGGIATLLKDVFKDSMILGTHINSSLIILILNIILLLFALIFVSKEFFLKTLYASLIYPVYVFILEFVIQLFGASFINIITVTEDIKKNYNALGEHSVRMMLVGANLLYIIFGAVISGLGLGLALKKGASTGGVDIIQQILLKYFKIPFSVSLFLIDGTIVVVSAFYFDNIFVVLYGFLFIYLSGVVLDSVAFSGFNSRAVNIISSKYEEIKQVIYEQLARGVTEVKSKGGYYHNEYPMLICIMSNREFYKIRSYIQNIDPRAFIYVSKASEVHGEGFSYESEE